MQGVQVRPTGGPVDLNRPSLHVASGVQDADGFPVPVSPRCDEQFRRVPTRRQYPIPEIEPESAWNTKTITLY